MRIIIALIVIVLISVGGGGLYLKSLMSPRDMSDNTYRVFIVKQDQSFSTISENLYKEKFIQSPLSLKIATYLTPDKGKNIQAGSFQLAASMSPIQILQEFAHGKLDVRVTIIEGWRREEIAENVEKTFTQNDLSFDKSKFLQATVGKEGYLFPDTYLFPISTDEVTIASILEATLQKKLTPQMKADIEKSPYSFKEILTMASIVEREARTLESRKMVAGILWNRIENDWPLQADATLQYAKGFDSVQQTWWKPPIGKDKDIDSPYNTYKNPGLPPGPICNPSLSSIEATIYPKTSKFWYYITDNNGVMHYAETIDQHNQNVNQYLR